MSLAVGAAGSAAGSVVISVAGGGESGTGAVFGTTIGDTNPGVTGSTGTSANTGIVPHEM